MQVRVVIAVAVSLISIAGAAEAQKPRPGPRAKLSESWRLPQERSMSGSLPATYSDRR
jgi:hypothetical protein